MELKEAVALARKAADGLIDDSQEWLTTFDAKMTSLGFANTGAKCICPEADMGHEPECGWGPAPTADSIPKKSANGQYQGATITQNESKGGIELRFPQKPSADILARLKSNGWRWSGRSSCWWIKFSPLAMDLAESIVAGVCGASGGEDGGLRSMTDVDTLQEEVWARQVGR